MKRREMPMVVALIILGWPPLVKQIKKAIEELVDLFWSLVEWIGKEFWPT